MKKFLMFVCMFLVPFFSGCEYAEEYGESVPGTVDEYTGAEMRTSYELSGSIGEVGRVSIYQKSSNFWKKVRLRNSYVDPVVIIGPPSYDAGNPMTVRVRKCKSRSFEFQLDEWDYLDGKHGSETVSYIVVEKGSYVLPGNMKIEAGKKRTNHNWRKIRFSAKFDDIPVVLSQVCSTGGNEAVTSQNRDVSRNSVSIRLKEQEDADGVHKWETVSWVAIEQKDVDLGNTAYSSSTYKDLKQFWERVRFGGDYSSSPIFLADMQTTTGNDPATLRYKCLNNYGVNIVVQEEKSANNETRHNNEQIGYVVFNRSGNYLKSVGDPSTAKKSNTNNTIQKEVINASKVCDLGRALFSDDAFTFDELRNFGLDEKITWATQSDIPETAAAAVFCMDICITVRICGSI